MLRPYQETDLPALTRFLGENWKRDKFTNFHPGDFIHWMSNKFQGKRLEHQFHVVKENDELIAVVELNARSGMYAPVMATDKRGSTWELEFHQACVAEMRKRLKETDKKYLMINLVLGDEAGEKCVEHLGFKGEKSDYTQLMRSLESIPEVQLPDGFSIRSAAGEHEAELLGEVHNGAFGPKWGSSDYDYLKVMQTPGYDIERELIAVAPDGRFAAFAVIWFDPISHSGLFEPVGCHEDFRRLGLSTALLYEGMQRMKEQGMQVAHVGCESEPACKLYTSVGFETYFETVDYVLEL